MPAVTEAPRKSRTADPRAKNLEKANAARHGRAATALKADARAGRLPVAKLLGDERAKGVKVLSLLRVMRGCDLRLALDALLVCRINGARTCGELADSEREAVAGALSALSPGRTVGTARPVTDEAGPRDAELDRLILYTRAVAPVVELRPSEFAAARTGLEVDPLLLRMVDRMVDALRRYEKEDVGSEVAHVVLGQFLRYRNYVAKVARGEYPPPSLRTPAEVE
jgi:hypothetical protein